MRTAEDYERFTLAWEGREIEVGICANWLNSDSWHIELRCQERLPVTETGYRSQFVPSAAFEGQDDIRAFVLTWLDEAAQTPEWKRHLEDSRQLKLF